MNISSEVGEHIRQCSQEFREDFAFKHDLPEYYSPEAHSQCSIFRISANFPSKGAITSIDSPE